VNCIAPASPPTIASTLDQTLLLDEAGDDHQHQAEITEMFRPHFPIPDDVLMASGIRRRFDEVFSTLRGAELYTAFERLARRSIAGRYR
jgi:hypothetical protein